MDAGLPWHASHLSFGTIVRSVRFQPCFAAINRSGSTVVPLQHTISSENAGSSEIGTSHGTSAGIRWSMSGGKP